MQTYFMFHVRVSCCYTFHINDVLTSSWIWWGIMLRTVCVAHTKKNRRLEKFINLRTQCLNTLNKFHNKIIKNSFLKAFTWKLISSQSDLHKLKHIFFNLKAISYSLHPFSIVLTLRIEFSRKSLVNISQFIS